VRNQQVRWEWKKCFYAIIGGKKSACSYISGILALPLLHTSQKVESYKHRKRNIKRKKNFGYSADFINLLIAL